MKAILRVIGWIVFGGCICVQAQAVVLFSDDFNRADSSVVGNGWSDMSTNSPSDLLIKNSTLTTQSVGGQAGIYRAFAFDRNLTLSATLTEASAFGGLPDGFEADLGVLNNGNADTGYRVSVTHSDSGINDSSVRLFDGAVFVDRIYSAFQFTDKLEISITFAMDGVVSGIVSQGIQDFTFAFGARSILSNGNNIGIHTSLPNANASSFVYPQIDDFVLSADPVPEPATLGLLAVGLAGLGVSRRKQT